jgi:SHS2 domain-containing protein
MECASSGFKELEHTADWQLQVWGADLAALFEQAARGMYALAGAKLKQEPRVKKELKVSGIDAESLLVGFLNELLLLGELENLAFDEFHLKVDPWNLTASLRGAPIEFLGKEIKAVTFHDLAITSGPQGMETRIVFDV